jgi:hypothetical protein
VDPLGQGGADPIQVKTEISTIFCETENWRENSVNKETLEYMIK